MFYEYPRNLSSENKEIYKRSLRRRLRILTVGAVVYAAVYIWFLRNDQQTPVYIDLVLFAICFWYVCHWLYAITHKETYWQLARQGVKQGRSEAKEMLKEMKGTGNGKK